MWHCHEKIVTFLYIQSPLYIQILKAIDVVCMHVY